MNADFVKTALERFERPLLEYARRLTGDLDAARDVVQESFIKLCRIEDPAVAEHLAEWLYTVCRHQAFDQGRKERAMKLRERKLEPAVPEPTGAQSERRDEFDSALRHLEHLPEKQQEVIRLRFQGGLSYAEISRVTGDSVGNVGWLLHQALKGLRERMLAKEVRA